MRASRNEGRELGDFIDAANAGNVDGIDEFTPDDDGAYSILYRGIAKEKLVTRSTLEKWWTAAGKKK